MGKEENPIRRMKMKEEEVSRFETRPGFETDFPTRKLVNRRKKCRDKLDRSSEIIQLKSTSSPRTRIPSTVHRGNNRGMVGFADFQSVPPLPWSV